MTLTSHSQSYAKGLWLGKMCLMTHLLTVHAGDVRRSGEFRWPRIHRRHRVTRPNERRSGEIVISFAKFLRTVPTNSEVFLPGR